MFEKPKPARVNPPGSHIARELEARGWSQKDLADIMGRPVQVVNEIIKGKKQITVATAMELAAAFGTRPEVWVDLETKYRLFLARESKESTRISLRSKIYSKVPLSELIRRNWLDVKENAKNNLAVLERAVCKFLCIDTIDEAPAAPVMRHTLRKEQNGMALFAWVRRVEALANKQTTAQPFDRKKIPSLVEALLPMTAAPTLVAKVRDVLLTFGIRFVIVPHLPQTYLDGAVFYLDSETRQKPIVAITMRYDRIDWFWFTLFHELAHLFKNHYPEGVLDGETIPDNDKKNETEADSIAKDWLIPPNEYAPFAPKHFVGLTDVKSLATRLQRHPGIVLGRFQKDGKIPFSRHRSLLVRVKSFLEGMIDI
jgi:HTH-type transcriptional regulator / antitoxin HigA